MDQEGVAKQTREHIVGRQKNYVITSPLRASRLTFQMFLYLFFIDDQKV